MSAATPLRPRRWLLLLVLGHAPAPGLANSTCDTACVEAVLASAGRRIEHGEYRRSEAELAAVIAHVPNEPSRARLLVELGWARALQGRSDPAIEAFEAAEDLLGPDGDPGLRATLTYRMGVTHRDRGAYGPAERRLRQALALARRLEDDRGVAIALDGLAGVAYYRADFAVAIAHYRRALEHLRGADAGPRDLSIALNNLAGVHYELGDLDEAETLYREALALRRTVLAPDHPLIASSLINLGSVFEARSDAVAAVRLYGAALEGMRDGALRAIALDALGRVRRLEDRLPEALERHRRALALRRGLLAPTDPYLAESHNHLAETQLALGRIDRAIAHWSEALGISEPALEPPLVVDAYDGLARALARQHRTGVAVVLGKLAVAEIQAVRSRLQPLPQDLQQGYASRREPVFRTLAGLLIDEGRLPEAAAVLDLVRNEELARFGRGTGLRRSRASIPLSEGEAALAREFLAARRTLRAAPEDAGAAARAYAGALARLIDGADDARADAAPLPEGPVRPPGAGTAALRYLVDETGIRVLVTLENGAFRLRIPVPKSTLNRRVFAFRSALADPSGDPREAGLALYRKILAPALEALEGRGVTRLELHLDGTLRYVPFAALYDGERFLVEDFAVVRASSGAAAPPPRTGPAARVAAFGITAVPEGLPPLPHVREELEGIVRRDPGDPDGALPGEIHLDDAFSLAALERSGRRAPVLHIASHFVFSPGRMGDSFLVVGGGERVDLAEFARLDLTGVRWLALSACETGLGAGGGGRGVEIAGLGALARSRGADAVLASLWRVSDRGTSAFMRRLYRERAAGADGATALRAAQLDALRGDRRGTSGPNPLDDPRAPYAHPYYWAAFVLMGP